jgi:hypothetical protein
MIVLMMKSNEMAFDIAARGGVLEIKGHALCVVLEFKNCLLFVK